VVSLRTRWLDYGMRHSSCPTEFGPHELAVEDEPHESQRPKLDRYATQLFLSAHAVTLDGTGARLDASEIAVFITDQALSRPI
jgi:magnesium transporter